MNRQQRRAAKSQQKRTLHDSVEKLHKEGAGLLELHVVDQAVMRQLVIAATSGDAGAAAMLRVVASTIANIERAAETEEPALCGSCPRALTNARYTPVMALPWCDSPRDGLGLAICGDCASTAAQVFAKAAEALRLIWLDLRPITVTHPKGGRA